MELSADYVFREMMFGLRDQFKYGECLGCGCIQILEIPADMEKYYPSYYMAFIQKIPELKRLPFYKRLFKDIRMFKKYRTSNNLVLGYLKPMHTSPKAKILDIGCGKGDKICVLFNLGFEHVAGVDKFIPHELDYGNNVRVLKKDLTQLKDNEYDLLMMHHVLEHMDEQVKELTECNRILKKGGFLLICIPVIGEAWKRYKENWVQLDAPRHFVLHTLKSMAILAEKTGFVIKQTIFDSTDFQFWGSELYIKDIPLTSPETHIFLEPSNIFSADQLVKFGEDARFLNSNKKGDVARFYLCKN